LPAGATTGGVQVTWTELPSPYDDSSDDDPRTTSAETLDPGHGNWYPGRLDGSGWTPGAVRPPTSECGDTTTFPPYQNGDYVGDVDWRMVDVTAAGELCSWFRFNQDMGQADVLAY